MNNEPETRTVVRGGGTKGFIKSTFENNSNVSSKTYEENKLKKYFPQYFDKDGKFNFDKFKSALDNENVQYSDEEFSNKENYSLNFVGKKFAQIITGQEPTTVITPDIEHNSKEENKNSENIYIKGDNLEALKHMLNSYENKIKCIYIDPPYNTRSDDFAYPDNFKYDKKTLLKMGLNEEEAERVEKLYGKSTHSAWLTFMLPRLAIARDLLSDDGVIFISIDDNEQANLKCLCDEIFGEDNFIANQIITSAPAGTQSSIDFAIQQSYCLVYRKTTDYHTALIPLTNEEIKNKFSAKDSKGWYYIERLWKRGIGGRKEDVPSLHFPIYFDEQKSKIYIDDEIDNIPDKETLIKIIPYQTHNVLGRWTWSKQKMKNEKESLIVVKVANEWKLHKKVYYDVSMGKKPYTIITSKIGRTELGSLEVKDILGEKVFDYPKYSELIKYFISLNKNKNSIILDFFSGSATTAHAVMQLNAEDGGNRKYIMVNVQEPLKEGSEAYKAGYRTICDIGIERIKRASKKIKEETNANIDYGFKIYELNSPSDNTLNKCLSFEDTKNMLFAYDIRNDFIFNNISGEETILQTWKVTDGFGFNAKHEEIYFENMVSYLVKKTLYLINPTTSDFIKSLIEQLDGKLKEINRIVLFGYSYTLTQQKSLNINIKNFNDIKNQEDKIKVEVRY